MAALNWLRGTGVAMVTPFTETGAVDFPALTRLTEFLVAGGVEYLVVLGTTAENATLDAEEQPQVIEAILEANAGRRPVVIGVGGNNTAAVGKQMARITERYRPDALLSVSPYYNKPNQEGLFQHYRALLDHSDRPIILYNVPGRTGVNMQAATTLRLAHESNQFVAVKEAAGDLDQAMQIMQTKPEGFALISGDDALTLPLIALGAEGVISVIGNGLPRAFSDLVRLALAGDMPAARDLHYRLLNLMTLNFAEGNPAGVKTLLALQQVCGLGVRLPLVPASASLQQRISAAFHTFSETGAS